MARIVEDLLELSRLEQDGRPRPEVVSVGSLAAEAADRVRDLAAQRDIDIVVDEPSRRLTVLGDRRQLVSAIANLIENGVKYSDPGSIVEVSASVDGAGVSIVVHRPRHRHPGRATRTASSSASTGSTGPGAATPAGPGSAWPSCATWPPTTAARCRSSRPKAQAPRSRSASPSGPVTVPHTMPEAG